MCTSFNFEVVNMFDFLKIVFELPNTITMNVIVFGSIIIILA